MLYIFCHLFISPNILRGVCIFPPFLREEFQDITLCAQGHVTSKWHGQLKTQLIPCSSALDRTLSVAEMLYGMV